MRASGVERLLLPSSTTHSHLPLPLPPIPRRPLVVHHTAKHFATATKRTAAASAASASAAAARVPVRKIPGPAAAHEAVSAPRMVGMDSASLSLAVQSAVVDGYDDHPFWLAAARRFRALLQDPAPLHLDDAATLLGCFVQAGWAETPDVDNQQQQHASAEADPLPSPSPSPSPPRVLTDREALEAAVAADVRRLSLAELCGERISGEMDRMTAMHIAMFTSAFSLSGHASAPLYAALATRMRDKIRLSSATPESIAIFICAYERLTAKGLCGVSMELLDVCLKIVKDHVGAFSAGDLSNVLACVGRMHLRDHTLTPVLFQRASQTFLEPKEDGTGAQFVCSLSASQMVALLTAFARTQCPNEMLFKAAAELLKDGRFLTQLTPGDITDAVYAYAKFHLQHPVLFDLLCVEARKKLHQFTMPQISQLLISLARSGATSPVLTDRVATLISRTLHRTDSTIGEAFKDTTAVEVLNLAMAMARFLVRSPQTFKVLSIVLQSPSPHTAHDSSVIEDLLGSDHGVSVPEVSPSAAAATDEQPPAEGRPSRGSRLKALGVIDIVNVYHAWAKVHLNDQPLFQKASIELGAALSCGRVTPALGIKYLSACSKLAYRDHDLQTAVIELIKTHGVDKLTVVELLKCATAVDRLGVSFPELEAHVSKVLPNEVRLREPVHWRGYSAFTKIKRGPLPRKRKWGW